MKTLLAGFYSASLVLLIYFNRNKVAKKLNLFDLPNDKLKIHKKATPLVGGFPFILFFVSLIVLNYFEKFLDYNLIVILIGTSTIFFVGVIDDIVKLNPYTKTFLLCLIIFFIIKYSDQISINLIYIKTTDSFFTLEKFSTFLTIFSLLLLINAFNLSDGINGLALGQSFFWILHIIYNFEIESNLKIILFCLLIIIFFSFFLNLYNYFFLGDAGSLLISSFIGFLVIMLSKEIWVNNFSTNNWPENISIGIEHIFLLFFLPGLDMLRLFLERLLNKKNPLYGDNSHLHHYLLNYFGLNKTLLFYLLFSNLPLTFFYFFGNLILLHILVVTIFVYISIIFFFKKYHKNAN